MKLTIIQRTNEGLMEIYRHVYERNTAEEILNIIIEFSKDSKNYEATHLIFELEDKEDENC